MHNYDDEYFFIVKDECNTRLPSLKADNTTTARGHTRAFRLTDRAPLIFRNGWKDEFQECRIKEEVADILFDGADFMVCEHIRDRLLPMSLPELTLHPSVYIDDSGAWHEDFWFLTFHSRLDCWDRERSRYLPGTSGKFIVLDYVLDRRVLDGTPLRQRLLFQMGGTLESRVLCHASLAPIFRQNGQSGAALISVRDYV